nr:hypothetical protein BEI47_20120 [Aliivibrio fischeri]
MAEVERFELPTSVFLWRGNPLLFPKLQIAKRLISFDMSLLKYGRGGEIRTPNTRVLMAGESAALS